VLTCAWSLALLIPGFRSQQGKEIFLFSQMSNLALVPLILIFNAHWGFVQKVMWPELTVTHSSPSSAEVNKEWSCTSTTLTCLHGVDRQNITFSATSPFTVYVLTAWGVTKLRIHFYFYFGKFICQSLSHHLPRPAYKKCNFMLFMTRKLFSPAYVRG
jgi:hypothetical protein